MILEGIEIEINNLCKKHNFQLQNKVLESEKLELQYLLANIMSRLDQEKSKTILLTYISILVAFGLFIAKEFQYGIFYFLLLLLFVTIFINNRISKYLILIKDLAYLKEMITIIINNKD